MVTIAKQIASSTCRETVVTKGKPSIWDYLCIGEMLSGGTARGGEYVPYPGP